MGTALYNACLVDSIIYYINNYLCEHFIAFYTHFPQLACVFVYVSINHSANTALKLPVCQNYKCTLL